jgi:hypothetical protein
MGSLEDEEVTSYIQNSRAIHTYWDYWKTALVNSKIWLKAITGKADYRMMIRWTLRTMYWQIKSKATQKRMVSSRAHHAATALNSLGERSVRILFIYSARDPGLDYFHMMLGKEMRALCTSGKLRIEIIPQADHTFTLLENQDSLLHLIRNWAYAIAQDRFCRGTEKGHTGLSRSSL